MTREHTFGSAEVIASLARERQIAQLRELDGLDTKAPTLIGLIGVMLGLIFASSLARERWNAGLTATVALLLVAVTLLAAAIAPRALRIDPSVAALEDSFLDRAPEVTWAAVVSSIRGAIAYNARALRFKAWLVRIGLALVVSAVGLAGATLVYLETGARHAA